MLSGVWELLKLHEPFWVALLADAIFASWLTGAADLAGKVPTPKGRISQPPPIQPPSLRFDADTPPPVRFPAIEHAAKILAGKQLVLKEDFDRQADKSHAIAFTVAKVQTLDGLDRIRKALVDDLQKGGMLEGFEGKVDAILGKGALSRRHIETVYRNNLHLAWNVGQRWAAAKPLVASEFPYLDYSATHDDRVRENHLALEKLGIGGTSIYRVDDPVIQTFWPGCWDWNCRCVGTFLTIRDAARKGIEEAKTWLATGIPPVTPAHVSWPSFSPPPGFPAF